MRRRQAFSLVEILVAVAILSILIAIATIGYKHISASGRSRSTDVAMKTAKGMEAEFATHGQYTNNFVRISYGMAPQLPTPTDPHPIPIPPSTTSPGSLNEGQNRTAPAVVASQAMLLRLSSMPHAKKMVEDLPPEFRTTNPITFGGQNVQAPMILDGYGNPLIFIPMGGISGVTYTATGATTQTVYPASVSNGVWASAGPDGDFSTGDDNEYSDGVIVK